MAQARRLFDRALTADPDNVDALVGSARVDQVEGVFFFVTDRAAAFATAEAKLTKACRPRRTMLAATCSWGLSTFTPGARPRALPSANMR